MNYSEIKTKIATLKDEYNDCQNSQNQIINEKRELQKKENNIRNKIKEITKKIQELEEITFERSNNHSSVLADILLTENMGNSISPINGFELLTQSELAIIFKGMDKADYRKYGNYPRFIDMEQIVKTLIKTKKKYSGWVLYNLNKKGQIDIMPPDNFYEYTFITPDNVYSSMDLSNFNNAFYKF